MVKQRAREMTRRKSVMEISNLPGKLADCSEAKPNSANYLSSRGTSLWRFATGSKRMYQLFLPIRGKILNVEKASMDKTSITKKFVPLYRYGTGWWRIRCAKARYHKLILMMRRGHIRNLYS